VFFLVHSEKPTNMATELWSAFEERFSLKLAPFYGVPIFSDFS